MAVPSKAEAMIDKLPAELTIDVMSYLRPHDLTQLARASKRYREFAQSALWASIELHRRDAHNDCFTLSHKQPARAFLDDYLLHPWCYRNYDGVDAEYDARNEQFRAAIREMYASNGKSEAWVRIKPVVRHLCLTVTHESPPEIWDVILSLPNLHSIEIIGEEPEDLDYEAPQLKQWASLLQAIRLTAVEIVLEHRKIFVDRHEEIDEDILADEHVKCPPDIRFRQDVVEQAFTEDWPNLKTLSFRGMSSLKDDYRPEPGPDESLKKFTMKLLPGVRVKQMLGNYMFFDTERGTILNQHGADGLKVHLEFGGKCALDDLYDSDGFLDDDYEWRDASIDYLYHLSTRE